MISLLRAYRSLPALTKVPTEAWRTGPCAPATWTAEALDLRIGTVHAFQDIERDVVIASFIFGLRPEDAAASWRFVRNPHLLAVFVTSDRNRLVVLLSADGGHLLEGQWTRHTSWGARRACTMGG